MGGVCLAHSVLGCPTFVLCTGDVALVAEVFLN